MSRTRAERTIGGLIIGNVVVFDSPQRVRQVISPVLDPRCTPQVGLCFGLRFQDHVGATSDA